MKTSAPPLLLQPVDQFVWILETASNHFRVSGWLWNFILTHFWKHQIHSVSIEPRIFKHFEGSQVTAQKIVGSLLVLFWNPVVLWGFEIAGFTDESLILISFKNLEPLVLWFQNIKKSELTVVNKSHIPTQHYFQHINLNLFFEVKLWNQMKVLSNVIISFLTCGFEMLLASFNLGVGWGMLVYICFWWIMSITCSESCVLKGNLSVGKFCSTLLTKILTIERWLVLCYIL
jgi:hypothetical protein